MRRSNDETSFYNNRRSSSYVWISGVLAHHLQQARLRKVIDVTHVKRWVVKTVDSIQVKCLQHQLFLNASDEPSESCREVILFFTGKQYA